MEEKKKLLIIEDDDLTQKFFQTYLSSYFGVYSCFTVDEFYKKITENKYDIILMDLSLRGSKDGLDLTKELRITEQYRTTPIIALTANALKRDEEASYKAGITKFLRKPIDNKTLLKTLLGFANKSSENI